LRILILHSKIDAKIQEEEMLKFENKEYDLLLSTSIVESGIDLPNANTMIVERSDRFGMADLHQLRGRVGRSDRQGYCYFLVENKEELTQDALKRLISLESNSYLGAGSVLAYHDLEIRGGGNLLGIDQSGHIEQIGLSLYIKMLEDELNALTKKESFEEKKIDLKLTINAFLNSELINEDRLRLELYRRLSKCKNIDEVYEIEGEIEDRFGKLDLYTKQFLMLIIIKILALGKFKTISNFEQNIQFVKINDEKEFIKARSKDDDDIIEAVLTYLRKDRQ
ncbi:transcription-repair coupling factor, partial [Campylobacter coli]|nr:transcription-repair coupling factor [Campylobacter coli]